ncbi:MAG: hypothetical protein LBT79_07995 [Elusimicrobiota bacterium]|jgi:hypothetical protein|nr:hypothetical protein [Elusimicrobiota bacterium]
MPELKVKRFADFAEEDAALDGDKISIEKVLNLELKILGFRISKTKYEESRNENCITIQFELNGKRQVIFTGSNVLMNQLQKYQKELPFVATIKKINKYYTFS